MSFFQMLNNIIAKKQQTRQQTLQAQPRKRYTGMSKRPVVTQESPQPNGGTAAKKTPGLLEDAGIYFQIIKGDVKSVLRMDEENRRKKETYSDFMEQHFGVKKK